MGSSISPHDEEEAMDKIIAAAKQTGAQGIHPGYGFLSENAGFAQAVIDAGLIWVGPKPSSIEAMGLKDAAKERMIAAGVPVTPGYLGEDQSVERLTKEAEAIGYPVLIKAVAGGGGKGMRKVDAPENFAADLESCKREAKASFGNDEVLLEKWITSPLMLMKITCELQVEKKISLVMVEALNTLLAAGFARMEKERSDIGRMKMIGWKITLRKARSTGRCH